MVADCSVIWLFWLLRYSGFFLLIFLYGILLSIKNDCVGFWFCEKVVWRAMSVLFEGWRGAKLGGFFAVSSISV